MSDKRRRSEFVHIAPLIKRLLQQYAAAGGPRLEAVRQAWERALDEGVRQNAQPAAIRKGILLVHVSSSPWLHQLQFMKSDILSRLNAEAGGGEALQDVVFKIGPLPGDG